MVLLHEYVQSASIRSHCYAVAAAMEHYAQKFTQDKDLWWMTGLLHDFDYEKYPTEHVTQGVKILAAQGYPQELIEAIQGHVDYVPRESLMAKTLFAVDELCGFIVALAKVKNGFTMDAGSVKRALKKKGFAAAVSREDIEAGIIELGVDKDEHFSAVITALSSIQVQLGFST